QIVREIAIDPAVDRLDWVDASRNLSTVTQQTRRGVRVLLCCHDAVWRNGDRIGAVGCQRSLIFLISRLLGFRFRYGLASGFFKNCAAIAAAILFLDLAQLLEIVAAHLDSLAADPDLHSRPPPPRCAIDRNQPMRIAKAHVVRRSRQLYALLSEDLGGDGKVVDRSHGRPPKRSRRPLAARTSAARSISMVYGGWVIDAPPWRCSTKPRLCRANGGRGAH